MGFQQTPMKAEVRNKVRGVLRFFTQKSFDDRWRILITCRGIIYGVHPQL